MTRLKVCSIPDSSLFNKWEGCVGEDHTLKLLDVYINFIYDYNYRKDILKLLNASLQAKLRVVMRVVSRITYIQRITFRGTLPRGTH
jgi:hypothetical protein